MVIGGAQALTVLERSSAHLVSQFDLVCPEKPAKGDGTL
jgi:hypothetical protein